MRTRHKETCNKGSDTINIAFKKVTVFILFILIIAGIGYSLSGCAFAGTKTVLEPGDTAYDYGVFIGIDSNLSQCEKYETVVIDAQYFSEDEITSFAQKGHKIYSYLNIGSLENFRGYYQRFSPLALGSYENWDEERWMDVSSAAWQRFILDELAPEMLQKGIDGFCVDNCDVYDQCPEQGIFDGLVTIMQGLMQTGKKVIINSGDAFVNEYCKSGGDVSDIITGINQESVFSSIQWASGTFGEASKESLEYFTTYIEKYASLGADIYLLEYATDSTIVQKVSDYCVDKGFTLYIANNIELK